MILITLDTTIPTEEGYYLCRIKNTQTTSKLVYVGRAQMTSSDQNKGYIRGLTVNIGPDNEAIPLSWTNLLWSQKLDITINQT